MASEKLVVWNVVTMSEVFSVIVGVFAMFPSKFQCDRLYQSSYETFRVMLPCFFPNLTEAVGGI